MDNRNYAELQKSANKAKLEKLKINERKKDFDNLTLSYCYNRIIKELNKFYKALMEVFESMSREKDIKIIIEKIEAVRAEAADVGNFADMAIFRSDEMIEQCKQHLDKK